MVIRIFLIALIFSGAFYSIYSQDISSRAYTDKTNYEIGDYIYYTIEVSHSKHLRVFKPVLSDYLKNVEVIKSEEPLVTESKGRKQIIYKYIISVYDSADVVIPPIPITYQSGRDTTSIYVSTNSVQFSVRSLIINPTEEIKDVKPPITIPMDLLVIVIIISVLLLAALLSFYYYKKNQKKKQKQLTKKRIYIIPPHVKALTELHSLEEQKLWQQGLVKEYHSKITEIIRRYFEERFHILALESSTSEIMEQLTRVVLPEEIYDTVRDFLNNADLVKFAKFQPLPSINEEMMRQAINIVENTIPVQQESVNKEKVNV